MSLLGVGRRGSFSSRNFPDVYHGWISVHYFFCLTRFIPTPCVFSCTGFSAVSDLENFLRDLLLRFLSRINISNVIRGGSNFWRIFLIVPARYGLFVPSYLFGDLCYCLWVSDIILLLSNFFSRRIQSGQKIFWLLVWWRSFCGILIVPQFHVMKGAPKFWRDCFALPRGICPLSYLFYRLMTENVLTGWSPYLWRVFGLAFFPCSLWRRRG